MAKRSRRKKSNPRPDLLSRLRGEDFLNSARTFLRRHFALIDGWRLSLNRANFKILNRLPLGDFLLMTVAMSAWGLIVVGLGLLTGAHR